MHAAPSPSPVPSPARRSGLSVATGIVGELLLTVGALLGLFVIWQVWWTDVEAAAHQEVVISDWHQGQDVIVAPERAGEAKTGPAPSIDPFEQGEVMGILHVPRWGADHRTTIAHGTDMDTVLNRGYAGHYDHTQLPGEVGNFALAAHRQSRGAPFRAVDQLQVGDSLIVETADTYLVYQVSDHEIVLPHQTEVLYPVPHQADAEPTEAMITLTTCHPLWSTKERWITYGVLDHWVDKADGKPAELLIEEEGS